MQFMIRGPMSGLRGLRPVVLLGVIAVALGMESLMTDTVGSQILQVNDVQLDSLGDLGDATADMDAPEQLNLVSPPKVHTAAPEVALLQDKTSHKQQGKAVRGLKARRQAPLAAASAPEPAKTEVISEDADVEQLGDKLQNMMSEVGDAAQVAVEKQMAPATATKQSIATQAPAKVEQSASDEELASMDKEVGDVKEAKDDSENVVNGAMAYIRTRLAAEEHKSLRLRQLLAQAVRSNRNMRQKLGQLGDQLTEGAKLQKSLRTVSAQKVSQEEVKMSQEKTRADTVAKQLTNATKAAQIGEKAMKFLGMRLKYTKSQVAALLLNLANSSYENKDLKRRLSNVTAAEVKDTTLLATTRKQAAAQAQELADTKAKLEKLEAAKKVEDTQLTALDRQKNLLEHRQSSSLNRDFIINKENSLLKKQLATEITREEQLRQMWSKESEAFTWQLRAERANATESLSDLEKARNEFRDLRERVQKLRQRASVGEQSRHKAEDAANRAQFALASAEAENKQLKGSVPWLEAEVDRQRLAAQNATKEATQALKERDTVKAILGEAQKNIVQLQGQYADALQALVVAQAGGNVDSPKLQAEAPASSIQQFALGENPLGLPPTVTSLELPGANGASSLLELSRDSRSLNSVMAPAQVAPPTGRVDLSKDSGGLSALLRGMQNRK